MPVVDPNVLECVFYLYPGLSQAETGSASGGTGFFVGIELEINKPYQQLYAVTNRHCILACKETVVLRVNKTDGQLDYLETKAGDWFFHEDYCDIAVLPVELGQEHSFNFVGSSVFFLTQKIIAERGLGPGDDVFMVGRFISQDGKQRNLPTVRFGNISRMNGELIEHESGIGQDSLLVEMRSFSGYSGSPVFVHINPTLARPPHYMTPINHPYNQSFHGPWLLGIDWGHVPSFKPVLDSKRKSPTEAAQVVEINSGMACVTPAWRILEILDSPKLTQLRRQVDASITDRLSNNYATI